MLKIPETAEEITPEWLTAVLNVDGALTSGHVRRIEVKPVPEGMGFYGQVLRLAVVYQNANPDAPTSLIAKLPVTDPGIRQLVARLGAYDREIRFYREFRGRTPLRTPRCYYADGDKASASYILLLEDLNLTGRCGNTVAGCTADEVRLGLRALARHHAFWWQRKELEASDWIQPLSERIHVGMSLYPSCWQPFLDSMADLLSPAIQQALPTLDDTVRQVFEGWKEGPFTLLHGDYRADNLFFGFDNGPYELAAIDWQLPSKGVAAVDVAFFLGCSLATDIRAAHDVRLRDTYYEALVGHGVGHYSRAAFAADLARGYLANLCGFVIAYVALNPTGERGQAYFRTSIERLGHAIDECEVLTKTHP